MTIEAFASTKDLICATEHISGDVANNNLAYKAFRIKNFNLEQKDKVREVEFIKLILPDVPWNIMRSPPVTLDLSKMKVITKFKLRYIQEINTNAYYRTAHGGRMMLIAKNSGVEIQTLYISVPTIFKSKMSSSSNECFMAN